MLVHVEFVVVVITFDHEQGPFLKGEVLYVSHHGWQAKKILSFRWSKKTEITLEIISFWKNIYINIFKFSSFLSIKSNQFFKIY